MLEELMKLKRSISHAIDGLAYAIQRERNFRIELVAAFFILALIFILKIKSWEAIILILMIMWVLIMELINTVFERVVDMLKPKIHPYARLIKDIMASAVLISSIVAMIVGIIIFYPYLKGLLSMYI
jgi:diacylglycerol kinase